MKHKIAGISLFFCLVAPLVATFIFLHYHKTFVRKEVKHQMIMGIDKEKLVLLRFTEAESQTKLGWEHPEEFEFDGRMYDVVEKEIKGDTIYYWCWIDHEETELNRQLDDLVAKILGNNPQRKDRQDKLVEFYKKLYYNGYPDLLRYSFLQLIKDFQTYIEHYSSVYQSPPVPPPRLG